MLFLVSALLVSGATLLFGPGAAVLSPDAVLKKLGLNPGNANAMIFDAFSSPSFYIPTVNRLKSITTGERAGLVMEMAEYARTYSRTQEFRKAYLEFRESVKPVPPDPPKTSKELKEEQRAILKQSIKETEEAMKDFPPEMRATMREVLEGYRKTLKELDDPANPMFSPEMDRMNAEADKMARQEHQSMLEAWQQEYPATPDKMIRSRLEEFLEISATVDFSARLVDDGGKKRFVNPEYERQSDAWKKCFRAGKPAVEAGRTAAQAWLKELK